MSANDALRSKKQFKSQSVNSLFRQQTNNDGSESNNGSTVGGLGRKQGNSLSVKKKSNGASTKLKLVSKKLNTVNRSKLDQRKLSESSKEGSPIPVPPPVTGVWSTSPSPEVNDNNVNDKNDEPKEVDGVVKEINKKVETPQKAESQLEQQLGSDQSEPQPQPQPQLQLQPQFQEVQSVTQITPNSSTPFSQVRENQQQQDNFSWADDDEDNLWKELQSQIHNETKAKQPNNNESLWGTSSSQLSSFRKNRPPQHGTMKYLSQSPLILPTTNNDLFNEQQHQIDIFALSSRQNSSDSRFQNHTPTKQRPQDEEHNNPWTTSFNLWGSEDRQLSTKSDSTLLWSPFNQQSDNMNHKKDLDDPLKSIGLESQTRSTSRFFPSPSVSQERTFTRSSMENYNTLTRSKSIGDSINSIIKSIGPKDKFPSSLETSTALPESDLFPEDFSLNRHHNTNNYQNIPVSFPMSNHTTQPEPSRPSSSFQHGEQFYPEGFASTFYKRGINNFMFVRELQPKLITSKSKDSVEVRVSLPSINSKLETEEDVFFKMRCYIINVSLRELNGKSSGGGNNGYKLSQKSSHSNHNGRPRYGNLSYSRNNNGHGGYHRKPQ